ncbi:APC family permease, partial [Steroidobacter sp.]|uniref:APC family permease n=1 Tax=Steroidobacter sp. TaxID=1978227 RepID=UPI001A5F6F08
VGWFITLYLIVVATFEAIVLPWMLQMLIPGLRGTVLYSLFGSEVTLDAVLIGAAGVVLITFLNYRGVRLAVSFQSIITYGFLAVVIVLLAAASATGEAENLQPLFGSMDASPWWFGAAWIFANTAFFLNGFQSVPQAIEECSPDVSARTIARVMVGSVLIAGLFYCAAILCSSMATRWTELAGTPLATAAAMKDILSNGILSKVVLLAAAFSLLKTWNAIVLMASRLIMAQARQGLLPSRLGAIHPTHATPGVAVLFVGAVSLGGMLLGRGAILPLVNMASICLAFTFVLACFALMRLRKQHQGAAPGFSVPGGTATLVIAAVASFVMSAIALFEPLFRGAGPVPLEWLLILIWGAAGAVFFGAQRKSPQY